MEDRKPDASLDEQAQACLIRDLVDGVPELQTIVHVDVQRETALAPGEILAEVAAWTVADFAKETDWDRDSVAWRDVLAFLEQRCEEGPAGTYQFVKEWFLDLLPDVDADHYEIRFMLSGALAEDREALVARLLDHVVSTEDPLERVLIDRMTNAVPDLAAIVSEHVKDNGMVLSNPLFGDLTRWVVGDFVRSGAGWRLVLEILEDEFERNYERSTGELIIVSFLENLPSPPEEHGEIAYDLGPRMRTALERMRGPLPPRQSRVVP